MEICCSGVYGSMAHQHLYGSNSHSCLKHVSSEGMSLAMKSHFLFNTGSPYAHGKCQPGGCLGKMGPSLSIGKEPVGGSIPFPVYPEFGKQFGGENGISVL